MIDFKSRLAMFRLTKTTNRAFKLADKLVKLIPDLCGGDIIAVLEKMPRYERYKDGFGCEMVRKVS